MAKHSHREKILTVGLRVVHAHGFGNTSVRDIVQAAGVPQGSFTNHFASKEAFGVEIIDLYFSHTSEVIRQTLRNDALSPLDRLRSFIDTKTGRSRQNNMRDGCLLGNFAAEASDHSESIRLRLLEVFAAERASIADCLRSAVQAGEVSSELACDEVAGFIVSSLQGASLIAKTERDPVALERFKDILFSLVLRRVSPARPSRLEGATSM